jgi:hypothetical protein
MQALAIDALDLANIKEQESAKQALEVAAAGEHNLLMLCNINFGGFQRERGRHPSSSPLQSGINRAGSTLRWSKIREQGVGLACRCSRVYARYAAGVEMVMDTR